ncbi:MAG: response regulator [Gammaproteobacteria bacterium]|nr:response regulator [Gammaproteobacteria bacterium]
MFTKLKISSKLLIVFVAIGILPLAIVGCVSWIKSRDALSHQAFSQLESMRELKKTQIGAFFTDRQHDMRELLDMVANFRQNAFQKLQSVQENKIAQIEGYFQGRLNEINVFSKSETVSHALDQYNEAFETDGREVGGMTWETIKGLLGGDLQHYKNALGYDDLLLISKDGYIVYTANTGIDMGQHLLSDELKNTPLGIGFQKSLKQVTIQDFSPYAPAKGKQVLFILAPVSNFGKLIGVLAFRLSPAKLNQIVQRRKGMGETGESYLVGKSDERTAYRSDRIIKGEGVEMIGLEKSGADIDKALAEESGTAIKEGSSGQLELGAYAPLRIAGLHWGIITTIALEEVLTPRLFGEEDDFFNKYVQEYEYEDLLLIHPKGKIFYSVMHKADYSTDIRNGDYANSHLGKLFNKVLQNKMFSVSDYAPYIPSGDAPTMFIAQPLLHEDKVELMVVLQLDDTAMNDIMQQRAGMGKSGETYLVGSDRLMRSNSFLGPDTHSIRASFADPAKGKVNTKSSRAALEGRTGKIRTKNYLGQLVLSAYTNVLVGDETWALMAEMHKEEAFDAISKLETWLGVLGLCIAGLVVFIAGRFTDSLAKPLLQVSGHLQVLALGKPPEGDINYRNADEIGEIITAFRLLKDGMQRSTAQANAIAAGDYDSEIKLLSEHDQLGGAIANMTRTLREITDQNATQDWQKTGQAQLGEKLSGEQDIVRLAEKIINFLTPYVEARVGALYLLEKTNEEEPRLKMTATHAYVWRKSSITSFKIGESIVGQAAFERKMFVITETPKDYLYVQSGLGKAVPEMILVSPFLYEGNVKGVIELASFKPFTEIHMEFIKQVMPVIAIAVNTTESRTKVQALLEQSQAQAEELQNQQEVLRHSNEELQNKSEELRNQQDKLQESNEQLQSQSEELQAQQEELRQTNEELEERTEDLERQKDAIRVQNQQLEKTKTVIQAKAEELELANKYKSEFLANMSHELRTPLNSLLILAQILAENNKGNLDEKQVEHARTIHSAGQDLLTLINEILDLAKVEAGKMEVHVEKVSLQELSKSIDQKFRHVAEKKGLRFAATLGNNLKENIYTDGQRLKQIINNMLSNAFKFTDKGEIRLAVQRPPADLNLVTVVLDPAKSIAISVTDTGIGIPKDKQKLIFEAFQQADGTTSRQFGGTGLGLSISREMARLLGGDLQLFSEAGKGCTFTLYLPEILEAGSREPEADAKPSVAATPRKPAAEVQRPQQTQAPAPQAPAPQASADTGTAEPEELPPAEIPDDRESLEPGDNSILVIEDDRKFSRILKNLVHEKHYKCLLAEDGKTGLQLAVEHRPNAIILDVGLPQLDGWSVMERLKDNPETRHIPVHFMSASDQGMDARKMGAIGYLLKPVSMGELGEAFKKIEHFMVGTLKKLLVLVNDDARKQKILELAGGQDVNSIVAESTEQAWQQLQKKTADCIIIDIEVEHGIELLKNLHKEERFLQIPVVIYGDRDLTEEEDHLLQECADNLTIKAVRSPERLVDETTLFLHQLEDNLPKEKRNMLRMVHDKEAILQGKRILVVDDDVRNIYALSHVLQAKSMEVVIAKNGKKALTTLDERNDIDLVVMDIMMPEMDGYETMREIRKKPQLRKLPIIALTAKAMKGDKVKCIEAGANDYLAKPVDTDKLISMMRVWLYR